jgi:hypothetical protein
VTAQFVVETQDGWWKLPIEGMAVTRCFFEAGGEFGMLAYSEDREHSTEISLGDEIHVEGGGRARLLSTDDPEGIHWLTGVVGKPPACAFRRPHASRSPSPTAPAWLWTGR